MVHQQPLLSSCQLSRDMHSLLAQLACALRRVAAPLGQPSFFQPCFHVKPSYSKAEVSQGPRVIESFHVVDNMIVLVTGQHESGSSGLTTQER